MKYLLLVLFFVALPYLLLQQFVMPALETLEIRYGQADELAQQIVSQ